MEITDYDVTETMIKYGGSFIVGLANLYRKADKENQSRLKSTFPEYWDQYTKLTLQMLKRHLED